MYLLTTGIAFLGLLHLTMSVDCPVTMPIQIGENCYRLTTDPFTWKDSMENCPKFNAEARMTSYKTTEVLEKLEELIIEFIISKLENAAWWIGLRMDDRSLSKAAEDRTWVYDYDDQQIIQKDYKLWDTDGGPKEKGLTCAALNGSDDFRVKAVDCGGPRIPVICMMKKEDECKHDVISFLMYGPHCIGVVNGGLEYNKIHGACGSSTPSPMKDDEMKKWVVIAARNSFLGGGVFMNMRKIGDRYMDLDDNSSPPDDMWAEGEPGPYECVGLSLQLDFKLKLKTMSCNFIASSLCAMQLPRNDTVEE